MKTKTVMIIAGVIIGTFLLYWFVTSYVDWTNLKQWFHTPVKDATIGDIMLTVIFVSVFYRIYHKR